MTELLGRLAPAGREILDSVAGAAKRRGIRAFLVGGAVRDLVLRRRPRDLDIVLEGDAVAFARSWASDNHRALEAPSLFGTIRTSGLEAAQIRVEFASARRETYAAPAALPQVFSATIEEDLKRRDFTVNAMALPLLGPGKGGLLDPCGGLRDLSGRLLRLLHSASISDDPTRAFRAVRYAERLSLRIEIASVAQIERERRAGTFDRVSGIRLRRELELLLGQCGSAGLRGLGRLRLESVILPRLRVSPAARARLDRARRGIGAIPVIDIPRVLMLSWLSEVSPSSALAAADRLDLRAEYRRSLVDMAAKRRAAASIGGGKAMPGELALSVRQWSADEAIATSSWLSPPRARRFLDLWRQARKLRLRIGGDDLIRSGIAPGPAVGKLLDAVWKARLERRIPARQELAYALRKAAG